MPEQPRFHFRIAVPMLLVILWTLAICYLVGTARRHEYPDLRHPTVISSAEMVVVLMVLSWTLMLTNPAGQSLDRLLWTLGLVTLIIHIVIAFWLAHGWSHEAAVEHVREVGGFGSGILASYLFVLIWLADVVWWWVKPLSRRNRPRWVSWTIHCYLAFIALNATVVFGAPERRLIYGVIFLVPGILFLIGRRGIIENSSR
jgi:hypothetical protein